MTRNRTAEVDVELANLDTDASTKALDGNPEKTSNSPETATSSASTSESLSEAKHLPAGDSSQQPEEKPVDADREFNDVIAELQSLGAIDPAARQRLIDDLKKTDPALWPPLIQYFRASLTQQRSNSTPSTTSAGARAAVLPPLFEKIPERLLTDKRHNDSSMIRSVAAIQAAALAQEEANTTAQSETSLSSQPATAASPSQGKSISEGPLRSRERLAEQSPGEEKVRTGSKRVDQDDDPREKSSSLRQVSHTQEIPVSPSETSAEWRASLNDSIASLESDLRDRPAAGDDDLRPAQLRLLCLAAGRRDDALRPSGNWPAPVQQFWSEELFGLATYLDGEKIPDPGRRAADSARRLSEAAVSLGETASLAVRNLAFCTDIKDFGLLTRFEHDDFKPGSKVLLYAEVENFVSSHTPRGHHTALTASYQIFDAEGRRVDEHDFPTTEEWCQNRRRDFFIPFVVTLPENAFDGKHTLRLTIEDTLGKKIGQSTIDFTIRSKRRTAEGESAR